MSVFYTGKGDKGQSYIGKKIVDKTCADIEALGELDELNSLIGLIKSQKAAKKFKEILHQIQESLFIIQSNVAAAMLNSNFKVSEFYDSKVKEAEKAIDQIERKLKPAKKFVISGATYLSAWLDYARAKSRNVERTVLKILKDKSKKQKIKEEIPAYLNRLSSLLFAMARWEARNIKEKHPRYK